MLITTKHERFATTNGHYSQQASKRIFEELIWKVIHLYSKQMMKQLVDTEDIEEADSAGRYEFAGYETS